MNYIDKIRTAAKKGILRAEITNKIHNIFMYKINRFQFLNNNKVIELQHQLVVSQKMRKKYAWLIREGADTTQERKHSNKVWICWLQGLENAPDLVKACVHSAKRNMPEKEIILLSEENMKQYIQFPGYILQKRKKGMIRDAQYSDLIRISLLCKYGGIWMDSTVLCTASAKDYQVIKNTPLFVYKQMNLTPHSQQPVVASNWFISADSNSPILLLTLKLILIYWKDYNYAIDYLIFHILFALAVERYPDEWDAVPLFNNNSPHVMGTELSNCYNEERWKQYLEMSSFHKLKRYVDYREDKQSNYMEILKQYGDKE